MQSTRSFLLFFLFFIISFGIISACSTEEVPSTFSSTSTSISLTTTPTIQDTLKITSATPETNTTGEHSSVIVVAEYPHDVSAFTQGLVIENNTLYEGTGLYGQSSIRIVDLETGRVNKIRRLSPEYFGEGIVIVDKRLIQITWKSGVGFVYDLDSFEQIDTFTYDHEGWGITYDGNFLYMSDGTEVIHKLDRNDYSEVENFRVVENGSPITEINELEYIDGLIYANIWKTSMIAVIHPETGQIKEWIDLEFLLARFEQFPREINVLNGIAHNKNTGQIYVTGKLWPKMFEIEITSSE